MNDENFIFHEGTRSHSALISLQLMLTTIQQMKAFSIEGIRIAALSTPELATSSNMLTIIF